MRPDLKDLCKGLTAKGCIALVDDYNSARHSPRWKNANEKQTRGEGTRIRDNPRNSFKKRRNNFASFIKEEKSKVFTTTYTRHVCKTNYK